MIRRPPRSTPFPTRRSSDLPPGQLPDEPGVNGAEGQLARLGAVAQALRVVEQPLQLRAREVDRKSTRLNSSHANISYAVFCLKKKNTYIILLLTCRVSITTP